MLKKKNKKIFEINGVSLSSVHSGMYRKKRLDLSIMCINKNSVVSGVFTKNKAKSSTIIISQENLKKMMPKYIIVNSGNANAGTGSDGYKDIMMYSNALANKAKCSTDQILIFSTGVIGERIKVNNIIKSIPKLLSNLKGDKWEDFSKSILTTDTNNKIVSKNIKIKGKQVKITGVSKGSGMIQPNMATMLSFVATDIRIKKTTLSKILKKVTDSSYNMISVDGETSTNDASLLVATCENNVDYDKLSFKDKNIFYNTLEQVYIDLAKEIIKDGEGATKFITININNASSQKESKNIAMSIANSPLVKTALFAEDPNWGRILSAVGNAETKLKDLTKIKISLGKFLVFKNNKIYKNYIEKNCKKYLKNKNISINIDCANGKYNSTAWTTDLSYEYIKINADYRT